MTKKATQSYDQERATLKMPCGDLANNIEEQISRGLELRRTDIDDEDTFDAVETGYNNWYEYTCEMLRRAASTDELKVRFQQPPVVRLVCRELSARERIDEIHASLQEGIRKLRTILAILPLLEDPSLKITAATPGAAVPVASERVFLVHGRDEAAKEATARAIEKLGLEVVILHERPSGGRTIIEKLEYYADSVGYVVVLLTPDDVGGENSSSLSSRSRQNVMLEMGWFIGKLGRPRVCALLKGSLELPSDISGVVYVSLDDGNWRTKLAQEMRAAGLPVKPERLAP
jgi:predicted nucleotide-binding protein